MKLFTQNPVDRCTFFPQVECDKPSVCGTLHFMANNKKWDDEDMILFSIFCIENKYQYVDASKLILFESQLCEKECNSCAVRKNITHFDSSPSGKLGVQAICKDCRSVKRMGPISKVKDLEGEEWIDILEWEGYYQISNKSRIKRLARKQVDSSGRLQNFREKIIKTHISDGYEHLSLNREASTFKCTLHRLMGIHFIDNPENKPEVNHKNGVRSDNRLQNLEWHTSSEQKKHAFDVLKGGVYPEGDLPENSYFGRPVTCFDKKTNEIVQTFETIKDAISKGFAINPYSVVECCKGRYKKHNEFKWEFA